VKTQTMMITTVMMTMMMKMTITRKWNQWSVMTMPPTTRRPKSKSHPSFDKKTNSTTSTKNKNKTTTKKTLSTTTHNDTTVDATAKLVPAVSPYVDEPLSYLVFCNVMEQIEAISGRLEIQAILTTLISHVIQSSTPTDLYDLVYLSSNSVAPSYECIELGIGDAILIKAIGEAYGTNPGMFVYVV
jgi:DNA ligase-1